MPRNTLYAEFKVSVYVDDDDPRIETGDDEELQELVGAFESALLIVADTYTDNDITVVIEDRY